MSDTTRRLVNALAAWAKANTQTAPEARRGLTTGLYKRLQGVGFSEPAAAELTHQITRIVADIGDAFTEEPDTDAE